MRIAQQHGYRIPLKSNGSGSYTKQSRRRSGLIRQTATGPLNIRILDCCNLRPGGLSWQNWGQRVGSGDPAQSNIKKFADITKLEGISIDLFVFHLYTERVILNFISNK